MHSVESSSFVCLTEYKGTYPFDVEAYIQRLLTVRTFNRGSRSIGMGIVNRINSSLSRECVRPREYQGTYPLEVNAYIKRLLIADV